MGHFIIRTSYDGQETKFKVHDDVPLNKILASYMMREGFPHVAFELNGKAVDTNMVTMTMKELGLQNNDTLIVVNN